MEYNILFREGGIIMKRIGIIDVGTMTIRLVIYELVSKTTFKIIEDIKESISLGRGSGAQIDENKVREASHTIYLYRELCNRYQVDETRCFLSSSFKDKENLPDFISSIRQASGLDTELLTEWMEIEASFIGAINNLSMDDGLLMDIGGTTTKLVWVEDRKIKKWHNLKLGGANLACEDKVSGPLTDEDERGIKTYLRDEISAIGWLNEVRELPVIGVGGSMRNLAKIHSNLCEYPVNLLHNYHLKEGDVEEIYDYIKVKDYDEKLRVKGLANSRADIFTGSLLIIEEVLSRCDIENLVISGNGMREGRVYLDYLDLLKEKDDVFEDSLLEVLGKFNLSKDTGEKTYQVFKKIYDKLNKTHPIDIRDEKILKTACYLGRAGVNINFYDHPLHSLYMILNSGLRGMSHRELLVAALIVSQQNKFNDYHKDFKDLLGKKDISCIKKLSVILRVSKLLNKNFLIDDNEFIVEVDDKKVVISVEKNNLLKVQISRILMSGERFKELFNRELEVRLV